MSAISTLEIVRPIGRAERLRERVILPALTLRSGWNGRDLKVVVLLILLGALNAVDLAYTLFAYGIGMLNEMNPVAEMYLSAGLQPSFICFKVLMVLAGSVMMWKLRVSRWAVPGCWVLVGAHAVLGLWWYAWVREIIFIYGLQASMGSGAG